MQNASSLWIKKCENYRKREGIIFEVSREEYENKKKREQSLKETVF